MRTERLLAGCCHRQNRLGRGVSPWQLLFTLLPYAVALLHPGLSSALQGASDQSSCSSSSSAPALAAGFAGLFLTLLSSLTHCSWRMFCSFCTNAFPEALPSWQRAQLNPAVAALELSGTGCVHGLAAPDTPHTALPAAPTSSWAAALHKTSSGGSHYILIFLFWNNLNIVS